MLKRSLSDEQNEYPVAGGHPESQILPARTDKTS